jgi:hypothetical protein
MEEHLAKKARTEPRNEKKERRAFDREKDVLQHKKLGANEVHKLVENAKELNSRFDKAVTQRSFV